MSTVKLATLLIKTLSKPLANSLKKRARSDARFHARYNQFDLRLKMKLLDYQSELKPLSEEKAIEMGSNFIAEVLIFGIGASCIIAEAYRSSSNTKKKTKGMEMDIDQVEEQLEELKTRLVKSEMEVEQLKMLLGQVDKRIDRVQDTFQLLNH